MALGPVLGVLISRTELTPSASVAGAVGGMGMPGRARRCLGVARLVPFDGLIGAAISKASDAHEVSADRDGAHIDLEVDGGLGIIDVRSSASGFSTMDEPDVQVRRRRGDSAACEGGLAGGRGIEASGSAFAGGVGTTSGANEEAPEEATV
jgi:hypothetical protein